MRRARIISLLIILLICFSNSFYSQNKALSKNEIEKLVTDATKNWKNQDYAKSLAQSRTALKNAIAINDNNLIARSYNLIGVNFDNLLMLDKAFTFYLKALYYIDKTDNNTFKGRINNNLANIYFFEKKEYNQGIIHYKKALEYSNKSSDKLKIYLRKLNITWAYFEIGNFDKSLEYFKYINQFKQHGDESTVVALNMLNGVYYDHVNDTVKANFYFLKAIKLGNKSSEKFDLSITHQKYASFLFKNKNYEKAYENIIEFNRLTEEITSLAKQKKTKLAGVNLELDEYKREVDKIETEYKNKQKILLEEQSQHKKAFSIIVILFLIITIFFYFFYQYTKLKQKNRIKNIQNKIHQNIINASIDGQESERKKVALFLHDTISASLSSAGMHLNVFLSQHSSVPDEIIKTKFILDETHDKVRDLSHDLLPTLLVRFGLLYALDDLCEKYSNSNLHFEYLNTISNKKRYPEKFETRLYFIISELLNNIIKHSEANRAEVSLSESNNELIIKITDNGKGFDINDFNFVEGFGLNQIKARINNLNGHFRVKSKINEGTSIKITVPLGD
ncbi:tetratricopeptide repeat-containing sensor histidine kinase [Flavobacterium hydrophilum]|uniref:histidine kinase n=1 Tax=Flavobacterium hydrophilum TaxID=2211445 RepID=A0A2V4C463_9FLAO|nr:tetratricopeptide repeat-containing sensor histidine kinase [Flavobacterium hydrophilum]PXY46119.1 two-component sensor histidine kinase [Flavobacterium hydrophilum]